MKQSQSLLLYRNGVSLMKVVYPICCGIDVHKRFLIAPIITTKKDQLTPTYQKKRFSTFNNQILALKKWLVENNCLDVCMESTGKYWIPVFNLLEDQINVVVANPKWVRAVKGNKDDVKDSKWIAELFRMGLVRNSFIPEKPIRDLREFTRYRMHLISQRSSEKNRLQNAFTVGNVAMDAVVSDMFGKSAKNVRDYLISTKQFDPDFCLSLLHGRMKPKGQELIESIEGYSFSDEQILRIQLIDEHITYLNHSIQLIDTTLDRMVSAYELGTHEDLQNAISLVEKSSVRPVIDKSYNVNQYLEFIERSFFNTNKIGKVPLTYH